MSFAEALDDPVFLALLRDEGQRNRMCLELVRGKRARPPAVTPDVTWRCPRRCLLVAVYATPRGAIAYHPSSRVARSQDAKGVPLGTPEVREHPTALAFAERAYLLPQAEVLLVCPHQWGHADGATLDADLARALKDGRPVSQMGWTRR